MSDVYQVDVNNRAFDLGLDKSIEVRVTQPGPPQRMDGFTLGVVSMSNNAPHNGEMHPDGDELLYVISGRVRVTWESAPDRSLELGPGGACVVPRGEWHKVDVLEPVQLMHVTPGPNGDHRPL